MLAFLQGASAARDAAQQSVEFAVSQRPEGMVIDRASVEILSPVPRPESIREFMVFEQHVIKAAHRLNRRLQFFDRTGPGPDHPVYSNCLESRYLKVLWARVV